MLNNFRYAQEAESRHGDRKGCLRGTRRTVLDEIERWMSDFDKPPIYWLKGLAGTGKTTIAQTIAEKTFADGMLGASFFCSRDFRDRSNLKFIFPTLAVQLTRKYPEIRSILVPLMRSDPDIAGESLYHQMDKLIVQPLKQTSISTAIIIDALDECKDGEPVSAILSVLGKFVSEIPRVKFFLTGRPEPRIEAGFRHLLLANATDIFVLHNVESNLVDDDIRWFLKQSLLEIADRGGLDDWPTTEQLDLLCERAAGLFVYAVATVKFIDKQHGNPGPRLDLLLRSSGNSSHEGKTKLDMDKTLDLLYMSILREAFGDGDGDDDDLQDIVKFRPVLGAIILALNPLSPSIVAAFLDLNVEDVSPLLSSLRSLLILQDVNHPVRPFHKSFPDFIIDPTRCKSRRFHISPPDHHSELVIGCLRLMNRKLEKNMFGFPDTIINDEADDLRRKAKQHIDGGLRYACELWHRHLADASKAPDQMPRVASVLHQFLEKKFLFWLEVLSVLGTTRSAVDALEVTSGWLEVCQFRMFENFPLKLFNGSRHHQPLTLSMTVSDLSLDSLRSLASLAHISTTQLSPYPPRPQLFGGYMNNILTH